MQIFNLTINRNVGKYTKILVAPLCSLLVLTACSSTKNNWAKRNYEAMVTRYNVSFNGQQAFNKALDQTEKKYQDDFTQLLPLHVSNTYTTPVEVATFRPAMEKFQKAIKFHSIKTPPTKGKYASKKYRQQVGIEEFNPVLHKAWMMMGKTHYYAGDFMSAITTFQYITQHFQNLPSTLLEARLWIILSYLQMGWFYEAETTLEKSDLKQILPSQQPLLNYIKLEFALRKNNYIEAEKLLPGVIANSKDKLQRARRIYLLGQVQERNGHRSSAFESFNKVISISPTYELEFNARIARTETMPASQSGKIEKELIKMSKMEKNKEYLGRIYYALGNVMLTERDTSKAIDAYKNAVEKDTKKGKEMLTINRKLADLLFVKKRYTESQPYYANAVGMMNKESDEFKALSLRSELLDELVLHEQSVSLQDSLLRVASLPKAEQLKIANAIIKRIEEEEKTAREAAEREKYEEQRSEAEAQMNARNPTKQAPAMPTTDNSWYFYNQQTVSRGKTEFQRKWGARKLEDNWRRRNKSSLVYESSTESNENNTTNASTASSEANLENESTTPVDTKSPEYYLSQLPTTPDEIANAESIINDGMFDMAQIFKDKLEDYPLAVNTFHNLLSRFPQSSHRLESYFALYMIGLRTNNSSLENEAKSNILTLFPLSQEAKVVSNPTYVQSYLADIARQDSLYESAYRHYQQGSYREVISACKMASEKYPLSALTPNYLYLHALSAVATGDRKTFDSLLKTLITQYPDAPVSELAGNIYKGVLGGKQLQNSSNLVAASIWDRPITETKTPLNDTLSFKNDPLTPHLVLFAFPSEGVDRNQLLYDVAAFHFRNFKIKDFDLEFLNFEGVGMLKVSPFLNFEELKVYRRFLYSEKGMGSRMPQAVRPIMISNENLQILLKGGKTFSEYEHFYQTVINK